jgi:hypothetical protein
MTFLAVRCAALALGLTALAACSSRNDTTASYAKHGQPLDAFIKSRPEAAALLGRFSGWISGSERNGADRSAPTVWHGTMVRPVAEP